MEYLVAISIGPVQSLIEAGRRSQDLWCGSWLLSEVSRAVALSLHEAQNKCLVFPSPDVDLQPQDPDSSDPEAVIEANIANVIRAVIHADNPEQVRRIVDDAKHAAKARLDAIINQVRENKLKGFSVDWPRFEQQKHDILETYAAWVKLEPHKYGDASKRLGKLLAARKQTKDFSPIQDTQSGLFKSTLDGANNTLTNKVRSNKEQRQQLGLSEREELDILGLIKRKAGHFEQFTPFSRVVAEPWLQSLSSEQLDKLKKCYQPLVDEVKLATRVTGNEDKYEDFPFDGEYLFPSRIEQEKGLDKDLDKAKETKKALLNCLSTIGNESGSPVPYGVLLKADGDRMGELLSEAQETKHSRAISKALHQFATKVRSVVREHGGHAIYTGGDDVLAFLPLNTALVCAKELADLFKQSMKALAKPLGAECPTLSVGLAVGHFVQPMRQLRHRAIQAEKLAKGNGLEKPRNALAIQLGIRSGHEIAWRCRWDDKATISTLNQFVAGFSNGLLPTRIMQDVLAMSQNLKWTQDKDKVDEETGAGIRLSEMERMLTRASFAHQYSKEQLEKTDPEDKRPKDEKLTFKKQVDLLKQQLREQAQAQSLDELANMLRIARWLSARTTADLGKEDMS
ncbi:type III-B CRISPR-associated protein Cas10/Cmr2 [Vibrio palustris]|uniref:CRISPR-associated protein n=1 Tax=Vibrio palustris TaxID=1918946 RepID=A0A1R4B2V2_9VIBR|nr:type III-B CRISPR-associated protein Cas10/Cmr2 [Vibrio palustris]SJL83233.1 CRISPR-associated protein [Vibrio palustris]